MNTDQNRAEARHRKEKIKQTNTRKFDMDDAIRAKLTRRNHLYVDDTTSRIIICEHATEALCDAHQAHFDRLLADERETLLRAAERQFPGYRLAQQMTDEDRQIMADMGVKLN